jgi:hypothetical protein
LRQELAVTEANLQGYQLRHGAPFAHDGYLAELSAVRDQLRMALARTASDPATAQAMTAADIAERIRSLLATHTVEPASRERQSLRTATAERPVVERILERIGRESRAVIGHPAGETPPSAPAA